MITSGICSWWKWNEVRLQLSGFYVTQNCQITVINWISLFTETYIKHNRTFLMECFCKNAQWLKATCYFHIKSLSWMFNWVLNLYSSTPKHGQHTQTICRLLPTNCLTVLIILSLTFKERLTFNSGGTNYGWADIRENHKKTVRNSAFFKNNPTLNKSWTMTYLLHAIGEMKIFFSSFFIEIACKGVHLNEEYVMWKECIFVAHANFARM